MGFNEAKMKTKNEDDDKLGKNGGGLSQGGNCSFFPFVLLFRRDVMSKNKK